MKRLIALIVLNISQSCAAGEQCTYSSDHRERVLSAIAQRLDGAVLKGHRLTWAGPQGEHTRLGYGGCHDLGTELIRSTPMSAPRTRAQVFALGQELATSYLATEIPDSKRASESLLLGLRQGTYKERVSGATTHYQVDHEYFIELQLTHRFNDGVDEVTISWYVNP